MASEFEVQDTSCSDSPDDIVDPDEEMGDVPSRDLAIASHPKEKLNPKDPLRPRRKKARRACYACQRAHLTCGDERPCIRCIKRGLQNACQDGVRKKAKYLHDASSEVLGPAASARQFQYINGYPQVASDSASNSALNSASDLSNPASRNVNASFPTSPINEIYSQQASSFGRYPPSSHSIPFTSAAPVMFEPQHSPITSRFGATTSYPSSHQRSSSIQQVEVQRASVEQVTPLQSAFIAEPLDSHDLSHYNFDTASFNFGNHYGALEFGILGHMLSGAAGTPTIDTIQMTSGTPFTTPAPAGFGGSSIAAYAFEQNPAPTDWGIPPPTALQENASIEFDARPGAHDDTRIPQLPRPSNTFSIAADTTAFADLVAGGRPSIHNNTAFQQNPGRLGRLNDTKFSEQLVSSSIRNARAAPRDPSEIYETVREPYSYTTGFHNLILYLHRRFSSRKHKTLVRIAKALASIRPSFISCTRTLSRADLIFMEKCFQRTLWEYEDFIGACGTPTIVCRRTGEVVAAGKEFCLLTGWNEEILLGSHPNCNLNAGGLSDLAHASNHDRLNASRPSDAAPQDAPDSSRLQPVLLAELLDDESLVDFYEDFARLAFGDARGGVITRYKLLRYQANGATAREKSKIANSGPFPEQGGQASSMSGMNIEENVKVSCACSWIVKRDLFDLPMMIVMNFLPCM